MARTNEEKRDNVLRWAESQLGVIEWPSGSNKVKYNTWFYGREVYGASYPWCMAFVQWCYDKAGYTLPYKTASCSNLLNWYKNNKPDCVVKAPRPGDIIIYNFGHTGIVESVSGDTITAIEGNTAVGKAEGAPNAHLKGRSTLGALPKPSYSVQNEGIVVVDIWVDNYGNVQKAIAGGQGTTVTDKSLWAAARAAAMKAHFNQSMDAPALQQGTITYIFKLK